MGEIFVFDHACFHTEEKKVLDDLTLTIPRGACFCFVGPSGAGKSSVVRLLNRLNIKTAGNIIFEGKPIESYDVQVLRHRIGFVFQHAAIFEGTVETNLRLALKYSEPMEESEIRSRMLESLKFVGLGEEDLTRNALKMSGGEQQRVGIARTLMQKPDVLCLDEPTASLDIENANTIVNTIKSLHKSHTIVMVNHHLNEVKEVATHVAMIDQGQLVEVASCDDFFNHPKRQRTQEFLDAYQRYRGAKE